MEMLLLAWSLQLLENVRVTVAALAVTMQLEKGSPFGSCWVDEELSTGKPLGFSSPNGD
jgi:hypothetical protein